MLHGSEKKSILICGVGSQGIVLFGRILQEFYIWKGYKLRKTDLIGLGKGGGSVACHLTFFGGPVIAPLIKTGTADYLISFEQTETLRNFHYLNDKGVIFSSTFERKLPIGNEEIKGAREIDIDKTYTIRNLNKKAFIVDVQKYSNRNVNLEQNINAVMLGAFASYMNYDHAEVLRVVEKNVQPESLKRFFKAYDLGKRIFGEQSKN